MWIVVGHFEFGVAVLLVAEHFLFGRSQQPLPSYMREYGCKYTFWMGILPIMQIDKQMTFDPISLSRKRLYEFTEKQENF